MPSQKWSYDDITNTSSPAVGVGVLKESLATLVDPGEFTCTGVFLPSDPGLAALQSAWASGIAQQFQVQLSPIAGQSTVGNTYEWSAYVTENPLPSNISAEKAVTIKVSLKLDSVITVAVGS